MRAACWLLVAACAGGVDVPDEVDEDVEGADRGDRDAVLVPADVPNAPDGPPSVSNVLFVIIDDVGPELVSAYDLHDDPAFTPTLERLADEGLRFDNAYATPWCSPTRASALTGQLNARLRMGTAIDLSFEQAPRIDESMPSIASVLAEASPWAYSTGFFGKWHLTPLHHDPTGAPLRMGFDHFVGTVGNLQNNHAIDGAAQTYTDYERVENGRVFRATDYVTSQTVDDVVAWVNEVRQPFFAWVGLHAIHTPWHYPPDDLHTYDPKIHSGVPAKTRAMLESVDAELGRLLESIDPQVLERTTVIVVGDNGSTDNTHTLELRGLPGKATIWETGIRVPLIVSGPTVEAPGRSVDALVHITDVFPTVLELGEVSSFDVPDNDGVSWVPYFRDPEQAPLRRMVYADVFKPSHDGPYTMRHQMVRNARYKLIRRQGRADALHDLSDSWLDGPNLLAGKEPLSVDAQANLAELLIEMDRITLDVGW